MSELLKLAERVEALAKPDWNVDCRIQALVIGTDMPASRAKPYTSSVDAALTLVPEGYDWIIGRTNGGLTIHAEVGNREQIFGDSAALALTAACLKARAQQSTEER